MFPSPTIFLRMSTVPGAGLLTKWNCGCYCCETMRQSYLEVLQKYIQDREFFIHSVIERYRNENGNLRDQIFLKDQIIENYERMETLIRTENDDEKTEQEMKNMDE